MSVEIDWSIAAPGWDAHRAEIESVTAELTERLLAGLGPLAGRRVLELGAGTGELAARLAELAGPDGSLLASDLAPGMVALLEKRLAGVPNAEVAQLDAASIDLPSDSADAVVFRMGPMLLTDPDAGFAEMRRLVRSGGRIAVAVWGGPQENPWLTTVGMAAMMSGLVQGGPPVGPGGPPVGPGGPFSLADADALEKRVRGAGFSDVTVTRVETTRHFRDTAEHVETVLALAPNLAAAVESATPEQVGAVRAQVAALTERFRTADGLRMPTASLLCIAG